ncbi:MAG: hypothetical protein JWM21_3555 [Acidobacteria bacterium]|nr:hypothetical protein [Acidobacteriota bacterium]
MKALLILSLFLLPGFLPQSPPVQQQNASMTVLTFKYQKSRQVIESEAPADNTPARAMIPENKNYPRNARINLPAGARDPNEDTIDGRSAAIEKIVQEARRPQNKPIDGFSFQVKVQNTSTKVVEILFWEYQFIDSANPTNVTRRQFLCGVNIKADKAKEVQAFGLSGPSDVVSVGTLANKSGSAFQEKVVINRVEYADGTIWQRKDWNFAEIGLSYRRAVATPWGAEMCRRL